MEPFRLCLALGPVAVYLLVLGAINFSRRPYLVDGARDTAALGLAMAGLVLAGPMELFLPIHASIQFGPYVWALLVLLYAMAWVLFMLASRQRIVIYNITTDELRPMLAEVVVRLDPQTRIAGDSLMMPGLGVQLHMDCVAWLRNVSLVAMGPHANEQGWRQLENALRPALAGCQTPRNYKALNLAAVGLWILLFLVQVVARDPQAVARAMFEMIRL